MHAGLSLSHFERIGVATFLEKLFSLEILKTTNNGCKNISNKIPDSLLLEKIFEVPQKKSLKPSQNDHCLCGKKPLRKYIDHHVFLTVYRGRWSEIDYHRTPLST